MLAPGRPRCWNDAGFELQWLSQLRELSMSTADLGSVLTRLPSQRAPLRALRLPHCNLRPDPYEKRDDWMRSLEALYEHLEVSVRLAGHL